jgi:hypothetical protein
MKKNKAIERRISMYLDKYAIISIIHTNKG